ncbi:hypothetical protein GCM10009557_81440 [Virgisporangium ochraceum]|uniref:Uncharacterized protein n=1 Tax=Virgisporangium ochraceum TaxID=65505 RepID=A0A8J4A6P6_9ACTN|nr:hypothetical protein [Virgisporangium ochraceum]GIJ75517.1 hypothetical protein Voc01_104340 [Virgisporangium ochraceum]
MVEESRDDRRERLSAQLPDWYRPVLAERDAETAFRLGSYHVLRQGLSHAGFARGWFAVAVELGGVDMAWRVSVEHIDWGDDRLAAWWMRYAISHEYWNHPSGVIVDPTVFALIFDDLGTAVGQDFGVKVVAADGERLEAALDAAARRFALVTADGRELDDHEALERLLEEGGDLDPRNYTPNSAMATNSTVNCDCKDGTMPLMARTMIRILVAELDAVGLRGAEVKPRPGSEVDR